MTIIAAADGSALGNPGPAGWAWYVDEDTWAAGGWDHGTNNMGELMAVLDLLRSTASRPQERLQVLCDSQYVINTVTKWRHGWKKRGWKKADGKPVLNVDLIKDIDAAMSGRQVDFEWVKGHAGHPLNEAADVRARAAATAHQQGVAPERGPGFGGHGTSSLPDGGGEGGPVGAAPRGTRQGDGAATAADATKVATKVADAPAAGADSAEPAATAEDAALPGLDAETGIGATDPVSITLTLEAEVMDAAERGDAETLRFLLSPVFRGVGQGGALVDRDLLVASEAGRDPVDGVERLAEETVAAELIQLAYRVHRGAQAAVITSWWRRESGRWRCFFRQESAVV